MSEQFNKKVDKICDQDLRYRKEAYAFIMQALSYTQKKLKRDRHVSGEELLEGIKDFLMHQFGPMTMRVLTHWGIKTTEDFGNIIFNLVHNKVLSKTEEDNIHIFRNGYDLEEVFTHGYRQKLAKKISRMRSA